MRAGVRAARHAAGARGGVELEGSRRTGARAPARRSAPAQAGVEDAGGTRPASGTAPRTGLLGLEVLRSAVVRDSPWLRPGPGNAGPVRVRGSPLSRLRRGSTYRRRQLARRRARRLCLGRAHPADRGRARAWRPQSPRVPESAAAGTAGRATPSPGQRVSRFGRPHCCEVRPNQDHDHAVGLGRRGCPGRCAGSSHRRPNPAPTGTPGADAATTSRRFSAHSGGTAVVRPTGFEGATAPPPAIATSQFVRSPIHAPDVCVMR